jgi:hypothetical protein
MTVAPTMTIKTSTIGIVLALLGMTILFHSVSSVDTSVNLGWRHGATETSVLTAPVTSRASNAGVTEATAAEGYSTARARN